MTRVLADGTVTDGGEGPDGGGSWYWYGSFFVAVEWMHWRAWWWRRSRKGW